MLHPPNPIAGAAPGRFPFVGGDPANAILAEPASRELGRAGAPEPCRARKTALTAILGVWGPVARSPRPQDRV